MKLIDFLDIVDEDVHLLILYGCKLFFFGTVSLYKSNAINNRIRKHDLYEITYIDLCKNYKDEEIMMIYLD